MHYIGIDIGGTTIKAGRVDALGAVSEFFSKPTPPDNLNLLIAALEDLVSQLRTNASIAGVGIGIPGLRNARTHTIQTSPHIPCLRDVNLEERLQQKLGMTVISENDANAGAYGEWRCGAGK